jgi:hypothetical protein
VVVVATRGEVRGVQKCAPLFLCTDTMWCLLDVPV